MENSRDMKTSKWMWCYFTLVEKKIQILQESCKMSCKTLQDNAFFCQVSCKILARYTTSSACKILARQTFLLQDMQFLDCFVQQDPKSPRRMLQPRTFEVVV